MEPDWSSAPPWAQWWAVDSNDSAWWYSRKPEALEYFGIWGLKGIGGETKIVNPLVSLYGNRSQRLDWKETLRERP